MSKNSATDTALETVKSVRKSNYTSEISNNFVKNIINKGTKI